MAEQPTDWQTATTNHLLSSLSGIGKWSKALETANQIHLAVFNPPYLDYILEGKKTVESRFSVVRCAPYGRVEKGDILALKQASGPIVGVCLVERVWFYHLEPDTWLDIKNRFAEMLCATDPEFWESRARAEYATLMRVGLPTAVDPIPCEKRDRRGWVILEEARQKEFAL